jgi:hypothetical protein
MPEYRDIPVVDLLVDLRNARVKDEQPTQQAAILALARQQGPKLLELARDIVAKKRLDPLTSLAVVGNGENPERYTVLEGNRRVATLRGLETPALVLPAFDAKGQREFQKLSQQYASSPISTVRCAVFDSEEEAVDWIVLRHDGESRGKGLVAWGADEKDRFRSRHGNQTRSPGGQVIDFVESQGMLSEEAKASTKGIISTVDRLLSSRPVREALGIDVVAKKVVMHHPTKEVAKALTKLIDDLKTDKVKVGEVYHADQRELFAKNFHPEFRPNPKTRLVSPVELGANTPEGSSGATPKRSGKPKAPRTPAPRSSLIPGDCRLNIPQTRINKIYHELLRLNLEDFTNACSVLLRVFVELSVDEYVDANPATLGGKKRSEVNLAFKIKAAAAHLLAAGRINVDIEMTMKRVADSPRILAASTVNFNQYVHNRYSHPQPTDLRAAWDEMQPFMEALWP